MADEIVLRMPVDRTYAPVARLVVGGLAARIALSYDHLEDLQLALDSVLERDELPAGEEVTVKLHVRDEAVELRVGPVDAAAARAGLDGAGEELGLGRLLTAVAQRVDLEDVGGVHWLVLEKQVQPGG